MDKLIARLEAATEGNHELDREIMRHLGYTLVGPGEDTWQEPSDGVSPIAMVAIGTHRFTRSLDAALTLVPEGWRVYAIQEEYITPPGKWFAGLDHRANNFQYGSKIGKAPTPPLALCIAALKARLTA